MWTCGYVFIHHFSLEQAFVRIYNFVYWTCNFLDWSFTRNFDHTRVDLLFSPHSCGLVISIGLGLPVGVGGPLAKNMAGLRPIKNAR